MHWTIPLKTFVCAVLLARVAHAEPRQVIDLSGSWQITEGSMDEVPTEFGHKVPVPGLVDLAEPPFDAVGAVPEDPRDRGTRPADPKRQAFWYRTTFTIEGPVPSVAQLKLYKAKFGTRVFLNGRLLGDHAPNFTPAYFSLLPHVLGNGQENELIIRIGASPSAGLPAVPWGFDFEKIRYVPGIYDRVELILADTPHVVNVQTVPDLPGRLVRAVVEVANASDEAVNVQLNGTVREWKSGREVGNRSHAAIRIDAHGNRKFDMTMPISGCHLWSPEDPFLYTLEIDTGTDVHTTRFGMRSFSTDPKTGRVILNGKPYFMRGSNVCIFRFFEDEARGAKPWDEAWVRKLHRRFKDMHWNSLRYCIGFPPERWYEIADEEGFLIQDEFPIWYSWNFWPEEITASQLVTEWTEWMRDRWNHPCVVIWDAQNETGDTPALAEAIELARPLDLSHRPWDNGWATPQAPGDVSEYHPYRANRPGFRLDLFAGETGVPNNGPKAPRPPYIINEYGWLWLNRDGTLPKLTVNVYKNLVGESATIEQRRICYARTLAAMTEFWRCRRKCAGVLHFCGLGYSRTDGYTSDNFLDVQELNYEPHFYKYVRDAFAPVGVMVDFWEGKLPLEGNQLRVPVVVINDLYEPWQGKLTLALVSETRPVWSGQRELTVQALGQQTVPFTVEVPDRLGKYQLVAELHNGVGEVVQSLRDFERVPPNQAVGRPATASSVVYAENAARFAVDGRLDTRWSSEFSDPQWIMVDLGETKSIHGAVLHWERAAAKAFALQVSDDGEQWTTVYETDRGDGGVDDIRFEPVQTRWVRMLGTKRMTEWGYSLWEIVIYWGKTTLNPTVARRSSVRLLG